MGKQGQQTTLVVTLVAITSSELYLVANSRYGEAIFLSVAIVVIWGVMSMVFSRKSSQKYLQQEIMRYLYDNNNKGKKEYLVQHLAARAKGAKPEAIEEIVSKSLEALEAKSKIAIHNNKIKVT